MSSGDDLIQPPAWPEFKEMINAVSLKLNDTMTAIKDILPNVTLDNNDNRVTHVRFCPSLVE